MKNFLMGIAAVAVFFLILFTIGAISHHFHYKWIYQLVTSGSLLAIGLVFLLSGINITPKARVALGLTFLVLLSPIVFYTSEALFWDGGSSRDYNILVRLIEDLQHHKEFATFLVMVLLVLNLICIIKWMQGIRRMGVGAIFLNVLVVSASLVLWVVHQ